jgi:hypothetical protein
MLGLQEILIGLSLVAAIVIFGKKAVLKGARDMFSLKKELDEIKKEELSTKKA